MISWFKGIRHPDAYHGSHGQRPFFEGWYHKMVTKDGEAIAVIPGVYRSSGSDHEFAFIMIVITGSRFHIFWKSIRTRY